MLTAAPHPQADKLQVLTVDAGDGEPLQVVCGAPNARAGLVGVFGLPGAIVPANGMVLKVAAIRGVESNGMMCSTRELELGDDHDGIIELPADAPVGTRFRRLCRARRSGDRRRDHAQPAGLHGRARHRARSRRGRARHAQAARRVYRMIAGAGPDARVEIRTDDPEGCPAFLRPGGVGRRPTAPSPDWMQQRLTAIGQKPISALVDITNYVMLDLGRPLHVYDRGEAQGRRSSRGRRRTARQVLALNGKTYRLDPTMTVIADDAACTISAASWAASIRACRRRPPMC